jgi:hypothetical protein
MKTKSILLVVAFLLCGSTLAHAQGAKDGQEEEAIRKVVQYYFDGIANDDVESMKKAFHSKAKFFVVRYNGLEEIKLGRVYENMRDNMRRNVGKDDAPKRMLSIDQTGNAASVKVQMDYANGTQTEYLSLIKFNDGWKVVSKVLSDVEK